MMNWNSKSPKTLIPRLTTDIVPASYCILSIGQGMRALMKKFPGSLLLSWEMLLNLLQISTLHIQPSLVLFQVFDSGTLHFNLKSYLNFSHFLQVKPILITNLYYSLIVESSSSSPAPKPPSKLWAILFRYPFCSLRSSWIPTKVEETSCFHPPVQLLSDCVSDPTSTQLFFLGLNPSPDQSHCFHLETQIPPTVQTIFWPTQGSQDL